MKILYRQLLVLSILIVCISSNSPAQTGYNYRFKEPTNSSSTLPISIGLAAIVYLINPILIYEDKKVYAGITKEVSVGFGKLGQHRFAGEYSIILGGNIKHHLRFGYKYDVLLDSKIEPSHMLQGVGTFSPGAGYFTSFKKQGVYAETSYGYSIRNHKLLFYPHVKLRHTFMFKKDQSDITDLSFGLIIGFANPFIDVDIRRKY